MATIKPQKTKIEETVVGAYQKIEDTVVGTYQKIEDAVVGTYQKIEDKFVEKFLEERDDTPSVFRQGLAVSFWRHTLDSLEVFAED